MPQTLDGLGQRGNLFRQPLGIGLLGGQQASDALQLVLHHLQLVDRFLLGHFQALGFLDQLLGSLRGASLQLAGGDDAILLRGVAGEAPPYRDAADAEQDEHKGARGQRDRLRADMGDAAAPGRPG